MAPTKLTTTLSDNNIITALVSIIVLVLIEYSEYSSTAGSREPVSVVAAARDAIEGPCGSIVSNDE